MAFNIQHPYCTHVEITFDERFRYHTVGDMDEIQETIIGLMVRHNFAHADICSSETGEILMIIDRT